MITKHAAITPSATAWRTTSADGQPSALPADPAGPRIENQLAIDRDADLAERSHERSRLDCDEAKDNDGGQDAKPLAALCHGFSPAA